MNSIEDEPLDNRIFYVKEKADVLDPEVWLESFKKKENYTKLLLPSDED